MLSWAKSLFPINRSITGPGVRETLEFLKEINPSLEVRSVPSGRQIFDWTIPDEWNIRDAYISHVESGRKFAEFSLSNLHVVSYSTPVNEEMELGDLLPHIYTLPDQPELVPYVTSYYRRDWGFCMSENDKRMLPSGKYRVLIDSELYRGELNYGEAVIPGKLRDEVFFSSYICHPSMANNELSGPVVLSALLKLVGATKKKPLYTYRFALVPETIGSLSYISRNFRTLRRHMVAGFNLSCVGDNRQFSHVESRLGSSLADFALSAALQGKSPSVRYSFLERGSDERQYCAPGIDLPVVGFCRTKYGEYPEYHTDADNFDVVTSEGLEGALQVLTELIEAFEFGLFPRAVNKGEPQLSKYGLFPQTGPNRTYENLRLRLDILSYADGYHSTFDIALLLRVPLSDVIAELKLLERNGLIRRAPRQRPKSPVLRTLSKMLPPKLSAL